MKDFLKALVFIGLFAIPLLPLYVETDFFFPFITGKNFAFRIIVEVLFASWILLALYDPAYRPKFSWLLPSAGALLVIMFFANLFGEYPAKSFWSNFERMDGYVTLVHVFGYMLVLGSVLTVKKHWRYYLMTSLVVAFIVAIIGLAQYAGFGDGADKVRIDSRLGNAAYLAIYMLFHIFFALWLFVESERPLQRVIHGLLIVMFIFTLVQTGTRGTAIALVVGMATTAAYIGLFGSRFKQFRKYAAGIFIFLLLGAGGFYLARDTQVVQDNLVLSRIANISIEDLSIRFTIWGMAWEGVEDRPLLGWGQGNFNYVFDREFEPELYSGEQWFDRAHNIVFDWLIAGGILGFLAYSSLFVAALYYLFWRPLFNKDERFNVLERGVVLGLLAGYLTHNLVVFDNIISYIFFAMLLAFIHSRTATPMPKVEKVSMPQNLVLQFWMPVVVLVAGASVYFVNFPHMYAAGDIIDAIEAGRQYGPAEQLEEFKTAYSRNSFADQEITEQLVDQVTRLSNQGALPVAYRDFASEKVQERVAEKPNDARVRVFAHTFYRAIGDLDTAREHITRARELSPEKPSIVMQQAVLEAVANNPEGMRDFMKEAYELEQSNREAQVLYAASLYQLGEVEEGRELVTDDILGRYASNDFAVSVVEQAGDFVTLARIFEKKVELQPNEVQLRASLAAIYHGELNATDRAVEVLRQAAEDLPEFAGRANCMADNLEAGRPGEQGC